MKSNRILEAIEFAWKAHEGQTRKGSGAPYILHPLAVSEILKREGCNEDVLVAAILHDVVEDTPHTLEEIRGKFGNRVAELVGHASEPDKSLPWYDRKLHTINLMKGIEDRDAMLLSCADKFHNTQSMIADYGYQGEKLWNSFRAGREQYVWYFDSLVEIYLNFDPTVKLFKDFEQSVNTLLRR